MGTYNQKTFSDGLYFYGSDLKIPDNGYQWLLNGRTRDANVKPISKHIQDNKAPVGLKQCIATLGNIKLLFVAGKAYYQLFGTTAWIQLGFFSMNPSVSKIYTCLVPASVNNFKRELNADNNIYSDVQSSPSSTVNGSISGLVVQDGITQPWFIYLNQTNNTVLARQLFNYNQWSNTNDTLKEYVPIGTFMMFMNQKLFIVARDGRSVYHSITGRPIDFMINVDSDGNKNVLEASGGASSISFTFDFNQITGIYISNASDIFIYTTNQNIRLIQFDYTNTIFDEPTYREAMPSIPYGGVNDKACIELGGDEIIIDKTTIVSFNAVNQQKIEAKNTVFSKMLTTILKDIVQTTKVCVGRFDDYVLFSIQSTFGPIIAVFDVVQNLWVSFDITGAVRVKEFALLHTEGTKQIFCITYDNEVFELFGSETEGEVCTFRTRAYARDELSWQKSQSLVLNFAGGLPTDNVRVIEYVDEKYSAELVRPLRVEELGILYPVRPPVIMPNEVLPFPIKFDFARGLQGRKIVFIIIWSGTATLEELELITTDINSETSSQQRNESAKAKA